MRTGCIYIATINGDKSYIGYTTNYERRIKRHLLAGTDTNFHRAIRKYGADAIEWRILEDDISEARLPDREVLWIGFYNTYHNGYNMTEGGDIPPTKCPKIASRNSEIMRDRASRGELPQQQPEWRAKLSAIRKAQAARGELPAQQPEIRDKMSKTRKAQAARGELPAQQPEVRKKNSDAHKARSARGECPMQVPEIRDRILRTRRKKRGTIDWVDQLTEED